MTQTLSQERLELKKERRDLLFYQLTEEKLFYFAKYLLHYWDIAPKPHYEMCHYITYGTDPNNKIPIWERSARRMDKLKNFLIIQWFRGSFKTTMMAALALFILKNFPWMHIFIDKADKASALEIVSEINNISTNVVLPGLRGF